MDAETLEEFVNSELVQFHSIIFQSEHSDHSKDLKKQKTSRGNEIKGAFRNDGIATFNSNHGIKVEENGNNDLISNIHSPQNVDADKKIFKDSANNINKIGSRFGCQDCDFTTAEKGNYIVLLTKECLWNQL